MEGKRGDIELVDKTEHSSTQQRVFRIGDKWPSPRHPSERPQHFCHQAAIEKSPGEAIITMRGEKR